jgi:hypothetical protein
MVDTIDTLIQEKWGLHAPAVFLLLSTQGPAYSMVPPTFKVGLSPQLLFHKPVISGNTVTDTPTSVLFKSLRHFSIQSSWQSRLTIKSSSKGQILYVLTHWWNLDLKWWWWLWWLWDMNVMGECLGMCVKDQWEQGRRKERILMGEKDQNMVHKYIQMKTA